MAGAKGDVMKSGSVWQPGRQSSPNPTSSGEVATRLALLEPTPDESADVGVMLIGNQVATQEGR